MYKQYTTIFYYPLFVLEYFFDDILDECVFMWVVSQSVCVLCICLLAVVLLRKVDSIIDFVVDILNANGGDNNFVKELLSKIDLKNFYGYSAWNTSANTLGSLICGAKVKFLAKKYNEKAFKKLQAIRLLDDWAYQANVRQTLSEPKNPNMKEFEKKVLRFVNLDFQTCYSFPWNRLFEIEVGIEWV